MFKLSQGYFYERRRKKKGHMEFYLSWFVPSNDKE
jgi:hypothetical protein